LAHVPPEIEPPADQPRIATGTTDRSAAIAEAAEAFHEAVFDLDVLLHIVAERISRATGDYCSVGLVSPDGKRFQPLVAYHADPKLIEDSRPFLGVSMDVDAAGPWARVFRERRSVILAIDPDHLPPNMAPHQVRHIQRWRMREAALIPLIARDTVVGGLNLNRLEGSPPFTPDDIDLLESLGVLAGRAIANARLLAVEKQTSGELERQVQAQTRAAEARALEARAAVARLQATLNTPQSTVVIATDPEGMITAFNSGAELLLGYRAQEVVGAANATTFLSPSEIPAKAAALGVEAAFAAIAGGYGSSGVADDWHLISRTGEERPVELSVTPILDADRIRRGFVLIARDISERRALEAHLKAALAEGREVVMPAAGRRDEVEELARSLAGWERFSRQRLEGSQAMAELGNLTKIEDVTRVGLERMGDTFGARTGFVALTESQGARVSQVLRPEQAPGEFRVGALLDPGAPGARALTTAAPVVGDLGGGGWSPALASWAFVTEAGPMMAIPLVSGGRVAGVVTLIRGRKDEKFSTSEVELAVAMSAPVAAALEVSRLVAELRQANANLTEANRHKSQFLASMSHELRTPLNAILGFSQLLVDDVSSHFDAKTRLRFLNQIITSGQHLLSLINDILDLSKVEAGQMELHFARARVAEIVESVVRTVEPMAGAKKIRIVSDADRDLHLVADPGKLKQMLLNLVSNAIKFTPSAGAVTISARRDESTIEIGVTDTGIGMSKADLMLIFQEFRQLDQGPDRRQEGTGLGLALTRRFAELHGGTVTVQSTLGVGSTFTLRLPVQPPGAPAEPVPEPPPHALVDLARPLVLVVEDNPQASELLSRYLDSGGFRVEIARTGTEALVKARELKPMAVTLDILLPEIDGWEVLTRLKQDEATRNIPVVIASVVDNHGLGHALGAIDYFVKPVERQALLSRLGRYTFTTSAGQGETRILLVDDEPANLDYLESVLEPAGFTVLRASGGKEGIDLARARQPHLLLLDLMMPEVTGFDVVEAMRNDESTRSIPIMVLTAKELTDEDKKQLNGSVAAVFARGSLAGAELVDWLHQLVVA
jgi:PAS domain S-box-containing protein